MNVGDLCDLGHFGASGLLSVVWRRQPDADDRHQRAVRGGSSGFHAQGPMKPKCIAALACMLICTGCAPIPRHVYVADHAHGSLVYEQCSLNPDVPAGVKVALPGLAATVSVIQLDDEHGIIEMQFDVPSGRTLRLRDDVAMIDPRNSQPVVRASITGINPAAPARYAESPAIQKLLLAANAPLPGGRLNLGTHSSDKHYWVAARFDTRLPDNV